jgi:hypothetical protein
MEGIYNDLGFDRYPSTFASGQYRPATRAGTTRQKAEHQMSILDEVTQQVQTLSKEELQAEYTRILEDRAKRKEKQKEYNASPEAKEKRQAYSKQYREKNPDKFKEQRKAYMQKPEVKERMKAYRQKKQAAEKLILQRAKELGITAETPASA